MPTISDEGNFKFDREIMQFSMLNYRPRAVWVRLHTILLYLVSSTTCQPVFTIFHGLAIISPWIRS